MAPNNLVVAHFMDGRVVKGTTQDFSPVRSRFHVLPVGAQQGIAVQHDQLKAVFFVKDLEGDSSRADLRGFIVAPPEAVHGRKVAVRFQDAEFICGYAQSYSPNRPGFFIFPADAGSNNIRIYVVVKSAAEICDGDEAEALANRTLDAEAA